MVATGLPVEPLEPDPLGPRARRPFRGREYEQNRLASCCASIGRATGAQILLFEGDAGMGKTRLLAQIPEFGQALGIQVVIATCDSIANDRPFGPLLEALGCDRSSPDDRRKRIAERTAAMAPASDSVIGPTASGVALGARYGVQDELVDLLLDEADASPLIFALDDAQWLDAATASTIGAVVRRCGSRPLALVIAARAEPRPAELEHLLHRWHDQLEVIRLEPLPPGVATEIAGDVLGEAPPPQLVEELDRAGGNAFSVVALARGFVAEGDAALDGVRSSVLSRVQQLGDDAPSLLAIAAILGVDFTPEMVATIGERSIYQVFDVLYGATRAGLLVSRGESFAFSHALIAEQLVADVPAALRAAVHRSIVRRATELGLGASAAAHHAMSAEMPGDPTAIDTLCHAAAEVASHDPEAALTYLHHASELCGPDSDRRSDVALRQSAALCTLKRVTDATAVLDAALVSERNPDRIAHLRIGRARCAHLLGDLTSAADALEQIARSGALSTEAEAAAWADVATYRFWLLQGDRPWAEAERAISLADSCGAVAPAVQAIAAQATMAAFEGEVGRGVDLASQASGRGLLLPHDQVIPSPAFTEGLVRMLADDLDGAIDVLQRDRLRIERLGDPLLAVRPATAMVIAQYLAGRWDDALAESEAIAGVCHDTGSAVGRLVAPVITGLIAHHRGDDEIADRALAEALAITESAEAYAIPFLLHLQALRLECAGDTAAAMSLLAETVAMARSIAPSIGPWFAVDAARMIGDSEPALVDGLLMGLEEQAFQVGLPGGVAFAAVTVAALRGDAHKAIDALAGVRSSPHVLTRGTAFELAGSVCSRVGLGDNANAAFAEARACYELLGSTTPSQRVESQLEPGSDQRQTPRPKRARFGWEALTPAELAVLDWVVEGDRNGDIAERLVLSKRTVESHVSSMLLKLGVRTRVDLVIAANRRLGAPPRGGGVGS